MLFIYALPTMSDATQTGTGSHWENSTTMTKNNMNSLNTLIILMPFILFFFGIGFLVTGGK